MKFLQISTLVFVVLLLSSCSPIYKIAHDYGPPKTAKGLVCLKGCQSQLKQCDLQCNRKYSQCSIKAEQQAKKVLPGLLQAYPDQLELWLNARNEYHRELDRYEFQLDLADSRRDRFIHRCEKGGKKKKSCINSYHPRHFPYQRPSFNLARPEKPSLTKEATELRNANCSKECGCDSKYRLCYTSCGGVVKSKKICIKNCQ